MANTPNPVWLSGKAALEPAQLCKNRQHWGQVGGECIKTRDIQMHHMLTYQNKIHNFSILRCTTGLQVIPDWQTWLNSNSQIWNPERKPSHFIREWCEILNILVNSSIFNVQFCTKSNALLSNVKSKCYCIQIWTPKPEELEKSTFHYGQKMEYFL